MDRNIILKLRIMMSILLRLGRFNILFLLIGLIILRKLHRNSVEALKMIRQLSSRSFTMI